MHLSYAVSPVVHVGHLVFPCAVSSSPSSSSPDLPHAIVSCRFRALPPKVDRPQLAPLTRPDAKRGHDGGAGGLERPPEEVRGHGMRV